MLVDFEQNTQIYSAEQASHDAKLISRTLINVGSEYSLNLSPIEIHYENPGLTLTKLATIVDDMLALYGGDKQVESFCLRVSSGLEELLKYFKGPISDNIINITNVPQNTVLERYSVDLFIELFNLGKI